MARIKQYETDNTITGGDKLLGTDIVGNATENFSVAALKEFFDSGINIVLPVPPGGVPVINEEATDAEVSGLRATKTTRSVDVTFTALENKGIWRLVADGSSWFLEVVDYTNQYYLHSIVGKVLTFDFINVTPQSVKITVDELVKQDGPPNSQDGEVYDYRIDDDGTEREIVFRYAITFNDINDIPLVANNPTDFTSVSCLAADNSFRTLDFLTFYVDSHLVGSTAEFEEINLGELIFDTIGDGITWQEEDDNVNGITANLAAGGQLHIDRLGTADLLVTPTTTFQSGVSALSTLYVQSDTTLDGSLRANSTSEFIGNATFEANIVAQANIPQGNDKTSVAINNSGITQRFYDGVVVKDITYVLPNESFNKPIMGGTEAANHRGPLTSIQIGQDYYTIPTAITNVATILPGLSEGLNGPSDAFTTGSWFYGTDEGTFVNWQSTPSGQPGGQSIAAGDVNITVASADRAAVLALWNGLEDAAQSGQRLFFVPTGTTLPTNPGDMVSGNVYEVVSYIGTGDNAGDLNFTEVGDGNIIISAPHVSVPNLPNADDAERFVLIDPDTDRLEYRDLPEIAGFAATMNYENQLNDQDNGQVNSITFVGNNHNHNIETNDGAIVVDVTGRMSFSDSEDPNDTPVAQNDDFTATEWYSYILDDITEAKTVQLPPSTNLSSGDTIRIVNLSDLDANGNQQTPGALWSVKPGVGDRIMKLPADEVVTLNDASSNDFIWSGIDAIGWIIK